MMTRCQTETMTVSTQCERSYVIPWEVREEQPQAVGRAADGTHG